MTECGFLERFSIERLLVASYSGINRPEILSARAKDRASNVIIKRWVRYPEVNDADLALIWRSEVRILQRLAAYPGGREYLTPLLEAGQDAKGFYLVLDTGTRFSLPAITRQFDALADELRKLPRQVFWANMRRLALGLQVLHANGLIHRNLDATAVFSALAGNVDFQLGGFEWTIVLRSAASEPMSKMGGVIQRYSFHTDWRDLGALLARMLGVDLDVAPIVLDGGKDPALRAEERQLLRALHSSSTSTTLHGDSILELINRIVREYNRSSGISDGPLKLLFEDSKDFLWRVVLGGNLPDHGLLAAMLRKDVEAGVLVELDTPKPLAKELALCGRRYTYYLKKYGADDWTSPTIDRIESQAPHARRILRRQALPEGALEIADSYRGDQRINSRNRGRAWDSIFEGTGSDLYSVGARLRYDAFVLLHLLQLLEQAANTWRIVIRECELMADGRYQYAAVYLETSNRMQKLSDALGLDAPLQRLLEMLERETAADAWQVVPAAEYFNESKPEEWTFVGWDAAQIETRIRFKGAKYLAHGDVLLLSLADDEGHEKLMGRRGQLLAALKDHAELTELLSNPLTFVRDSYEPEQEVNGDLDPSKRDALAQISKVLPMYLLQGPPGVGKTYLVNELVRSRLLADPSAKLLITSQGHDALNHLMWDVCGELAPYQRESPLIVRSRSRQERDAPAGFRMREQAVRLVSDAISSAAFEEAPEGLRTQLCELRRRVEQAEERKVTDRSLESLLLRSANVVFSTCNSADLKSMIDASAQFDATGCAHRFAMGPRGRQRGGSNARGMPTGRQNCRVVGLGVYR